VSIEQIKLGMSIDDQRNAAAEINAALRGPVATDHPGPAPEETATAAVKTAYAVKADAYIQGLLDKPYLSDSEQKTLCSAIAAWSKSRAKDGTTDD
jgi:hypothetical protein